MDSVQRNTFCFSVDLKTYSVIGESEYIILLPVHSLNTYVPAFNWIGFNYQARVLDCWL